MAPAAPALMQAIRAHEKNENFPRAATLALELQSSYRDDPSAVTFSNEVLGKYTSKLLKVSVSCDEDCKLDIDGKLEDYLVFFISPDEEHTVTATFETGAKAVDLQGSAGETKELTIAAPPPPPVSPVSVANTQVETSGSTRDRPPLPPLVTWIGLGLTVALGGATIAAGMHALAGVPAYTDAANAAKPCIEAQGQPAEDCPQKIARANQLLDDGKKRELATNVLIGATAVAAIGTGVVAFLLTDWSGGSEKAQNQAFREPGLTRLDLLLVPGGAATVLKGRF
jgi:hypothetical protein